MTRKLVALVALVALAGTLNADSKSPAVQAALKAFAKGNYDKTIELASGIAESSADYARARYLIGESQLLQGKHAEAQKSFETVLAKRPGAVPATIGKGRALVGQRRFEPAIKLLTPVTKAHPKDAAAHHALGDALKGAKRNAKARKALEKAYKLDRTDPLIARSLVNHLLDINDSGAALTVAQGYTRKNRKSPMGYFLVGVVKDRTAKYDAAISAYTAAIARDSRFLDGHKNLAILCHTQNPTYRDVKRNKLAFKHYELYFELGGKDPQLKRMYETLKRAARQYNIPH